MSKAIVLFSGGLDSTALLFRMLRLDYDVIAISFDYQQRHKRELLQGDLIMLDAKQKFPHHQLSRHVISLPVDPVSGLFAASALTGQAEVPEGHYADDNMARTVVPGRNTIMIACAMAIAQAQGAEIIAIAAHAGDHAQYPDCRSLYIERMSEVVNLATDGEVVLLAPFVEMSKADIVKAGSTYGVPFELTWSCYKGEDISCGRCSTDVERRESFALAGVADPTIYADQTDYWKTAVAEYEERK